MSWFSDNAPSKVSSSPTEGTGGNTIYNGGLFAGGGATGAGSAGGWNDPNVITPTAKVLAQAFQQGLTGQAAVDWATAHGAPGISYDPQRNNFGLPDGAYVAPNPQNPQTFDLISRGGGGGGGGGGGSPLVGAPTPYQAPDFVAPTGLTEQNDPGFQARMKMGEDAIQESAAAQGNLLSGGTLKAIERYGQDFGSNEFGNVFGRALQTAGYNAGVGQSGYQNRYGQYSDAANWANQVANRGAASSANLYQRPGA